MSLSLLISFVEFALSVPQPSQTAERRNPYGPLFSPMMSATPTVYEPAAELVDRPVHRATTALRLERLGTYAAGSASLIGAAVLVGYATRSPSVVRLGPQLPPMYPNAAIGLLCAGIAVITSRHAAWRWVAAIATAIVGAIGFVGFWLNVRDYGSTWFDLFPDDFIVATTPVGGRPATETCVAFILLAGALASLTARRQPLVGQVLGMAGLSVGLSAVVGYMLGVDRTSLGSSFVYVGMALHTGLGIALVGAAVILVRPNVGFVAQLLDGGVGGTLTRRMTFTIVCAPLGLIVLGAVLSEVLPTDELSQSVYSVLQVSVLGAAVLIPAACWPRRSVSCANISMRFAGGGTRRGCDHGAGGHHR